MPFTSGDSIGNNLLKLPGVNYLQQSWDDIEELPASYILKSNSYSSWFDTKIYTNLVLSYNKEGQKILVVWSNTKFQPTSINDVIATDFFYTDQNNYKEIHTRAKWCLIFSLSTDSQFTLSINFKQHPSSIKITDNSHNIVNVQKGDTKNSLKIVANDIVVSLTDQNGTTLNTINGITISDPRTLSVALRDSSAYDFSSTSASGTLLRNSLLRQDWTNYVIIDGYPIPNTFDLSLTNQLSVSFDASLSVSGTELKLLNIEADDIKPGFVIVDTSDNYNVIQNINSQGDISLFYTNDYTTSRSVTIDKQLTYTDILSGLEGFNNTNVVLHTSDTSYTLLSTDASNYYFSAINNYQSSSPLTFTSISGALEYLDTLTFSDISNQLLYITDGRYELPLITNYPVSSQFHNILYLDLSQNKTDLGLLPHFYLKSIDNYPDDVLQRHVDLTASDASSEINTGIKDLLYGEIYTGKNALNIVMSDVCGHSQASLKQNSLGFGGVGNSGDVALFYSLADNSGVPIGNTYQFTDSSNSIYICLNKVDSLNPLAIADKNDALDTDTIDSSLGSSLNILVDTKDSNYKSFDLHHLNLVNELPTTTWVKIYDIQPTLVDTAETLSDGLKLIEHQLKWNIAVNGNGSRKLVFEKPVTFNYGLAIRVSPGFDYSSPETVDDNQVYIDVTQTEFKDLSGGIFPIIYADTSLDSTFGQTFQFNIDNSTYNGWIAGDKDNVITFIDPIPLSQVTSVSDHITFEMYNNNGTNIANLSGQPDVSGYGKIFKYNQNEIDYGSGTLYINMDISNLIVNGSTVNNSETIWMFARDYSQQSYQGAIIQPATLSETAILIKDKDFNTFNSIDTIPEIIQVDISVGNNIYCYNLKDNILDVSYQSIEISGNFVSSVNDQINMINSDIYVSISGGVVSYFPHDIIYSTGEITNIGTEESLYYGTASGGSVLLNTTLPVNTRGYLFSTPGLRGNIFYHDNKFVVSLVSNPLLVPGSDVSFYISDGVATEPAIGVSFELVGDLWISHDFIYTLGTVNQAKLQLSGGAIYEGTILDTSGINNPEIITFQQT
jgi:hypothetical protein